jgi:hypothetical protein
MGRGRAVAAAFAWFVYFAVYNYLSLLVSAFRLSISAFRFLDVYFVVKVSFNFIFGHRRSRLVTSGHLFPGFATQPEPQKSPPSKFSHRLEVKVPLP